MVFTNSPYGKSIITNNGKSSVFTFEKEFNGNVIFSPVIVSPNSVSLAMPLNSGQTSTKEREIKMI